MDEKQKVYLICGVPGAGKTWVCSKLSGKFLYIPHDDHMRDLPNVLKNNSLNTSSPFITECPFGERILRSDLESLGFEVIPVFIVETAEIVAQRYLQREGKAISKNIHTRATTILNRAKEWGAKYGTAQEMLEYLSGL